MSRAIARSAFAAAAVLFAVAASAAESGTAEEAKAMLNRVVAAMKVDPTAALAKFNSGDPEFRDRDLYPFCFGADGAMIAHVSPAELGKQVRDYKDVDGQAFGEEMMKAAEEGKAAEGQIAEVTYKWPRPDSKDPVAKTSYITKIGDQVCGVGYYE